MGWGWDQFHYMDAMPTYRTTVLVAPLLCDQGLSGPLPALGTTLPLAAVPNPFNGGTTLSFALPAAGYCRLVVVDVRGRAVRTLWAGEIAAGPQKFLWDGSDATGRPMASGVYLARLTYPGGTSSLKIGLVR